MIMLSAPLSCGHFVTDECSCAENAAAAARDAQRVDHVQLALDSFRGQWRETLEGHGVKLPAHKKGGACPVCGGKDRFIFDDKDGLGTWHCRKCDVEAGGGLLLLSRCLGLSVVDTAKQLLAGGAGRVVDNAAFEKAAKAREAEAEKLAAEAAQKAAYIMQHSAKSRHAYLSDRGLHSVVDVYNGALVVPVFKDKRLINVQIIAADKRKTFLKGGRVAGGYHVIKGSNSIAICEGYATALTVQAITGCTTFCAFSAGNLFAIAQKVRAAFPDRRITIFADRDQDCERLGSGGAGVHYATIAAQAIDARICIPEKIGDWDDVRQWVGAEKCKEQMLKQIKRS